jgi:hypothetical protein
MPKRVRDNRGRYVSLDFEKLIKVKCTAEFYLRFKKISTLEEKGMSEIARVQLGQFIERWEAEHGE